MHHILPGQCGSSTTFLDPPFQHKTYLGVRGNLTEQQFFLLCRTLKEDKALNLDPVARLLKSLIQ